MKLTETTRTNQIVEPVSLYEMTKAMNSIKPIRKKWFEMSKKHYRLLANELKQPEKDQRDMLYGGYIGSLYGIEIKIKPYLKKVKLYTEKEPIIVVFAGSKMEFDFWVREEYKGQKPPENVIYANTYMRTMGLGKTIIVRFGSYYRLPWTKEAIERLEIINASYR